MNGLPAWRLGYVKVRTTDALSLVFKDWGTLYRSIVPELIFITAIKPQLVVGCLIVQGAMQLWLSASRGSFFN